MNHTQMIDPRFEDEALSALMEEATDTGNISMMSDSDIEFEVRRRFEDLQ